MRISDWSSDVCSSDLGAYGFVVAVFQWGWLGDLTGIEPAPIEPFIPMMMFAIVFGLSMDYEVFLLSRIKEEYERSGDPRNSVADGLAATARVISAAAAIMVVGIGRAHVCTPVTNAHLVCRLLLAKQNTQSNK